VRILLTADPYIPVPPTGYGGIERVIDLLVRGLVRRGHEVELLAHPGSVTPATRLHPYGVPPHASRRARLRELAQAARTVWRARRRVDLVHSFGRLAALAPVLPCRSLPKIQSYQRIGIPWRSVRRASRLAGGSLLFTGCSTPFWRGPHDRDPPAGRWRTVFNGVDVTRYRARAEVAPDAPLAFLGRLEPVKGVAEAIAIARRAGRGLVIAGNRVETGSAAGYFARAIEPHLDGEDVRWVGEVDDARKDELLGACAALLAPIAFDEPFGIVMAEAMACGTPVIAFRRGSVPEVVRHGVTGFVCGDVDEAASAVARLGTIDRRAVRADCEARFGADAVVQAYVHLYEEMLRAARATPTGAAA
jgi:glycosyltransferase involved in cell wall biosynthesis